MKHQTTIKQIPPQWFSSLVGGICFMMEGEKEKKKTQLKAKLNNQDLCRQSTS